MAGGSLDRVGRELCVVGGETRLRRTVSAKGKLCTGLPSGGELTAFQSGDDAVLQLGRIGGTWHFRWENLISPQLSGSVENFAIPGLESEADLYFGIFNHDARNTTTQLATLEYFEVLTGASVPEPASLGIIAITLLLLAAARTPMRILILQDGISNKE